MAQGVGGQEHRGSAHSQAGHRRGLQVLAAVGAVAAMVLMSQAASASEPEPQPAPTTTTVVPTTVRGTGNDAGANDDRGTDDDSRPDDDRGTDDDSGPTTTEAPTTTAGPTTTVASTATMPSAVYTANAECDPTIGETTLSWRLTNTGVTPVQIISTSAGRAVGAEPGARVRLGLGDDDPRRTRHR